MFEGWYNGDAKWNFDTDTVNASLTLVAKWKTTYTVTFDSNGGSEVAAIEVPMGDKIPNPNVMKEKAWLIGWYIEGTETKWDFSEDVVTGPITLIAQWEAMPLPPMPI